MNALTARGTTPSSHLGRVQGPKLGVAQPGLVRGRSQTISVGRGSTTRNPRAAQVAAGTSPRLPSLPTGQGPVPLRAIAHERAERAGGEGEGPSDHQANVVDISSIAQFIAELERAGDKLVVVSFHATWCQACRKVQPLVQQEVFGREDVVLLKVRYDTNKQICKTLSVKKLPFFHFYRGSEGRLDAFSASTKTFHRIQDAVREHGTPRCTLGENKIVPQELQDLVRKRAEGG